MSWFQKMDSSRFSREPYLSCRRPLRSRVQPPRHCSWSSYRRGYPVPGLVSTLLKYTYSRPGRLVQTCLQVTEQVWQPMHLSRFITMATWAITLIAGPRPARGQGAEAAPRERSARAAPRAGSPVLHPLAGSPVLHLLGPAADDRDLVALAAGRAVVVERPGQLAVAADHVRGLDHQVGQRVVPATVPPGDLRPRGHQVAVLRVVHEHRALRHPVGHHGP